jgi:hypothetical protein
VVEMVNFKELDFAGVVSSLKFEINFCNEQIGLVKTSNARTFFVERAIMLADILYNIRKMMILGNDSEVVEVVEVPSVVEVSKSSYAKKINQVREDLMKSQESIFFRETIEILKEFTDEQSSNVLHQLLGWFYKDDEFLGKMKEFALEELGKKRGRENSES